MMTTEANANVVSSVPSIDALQPRPVLLSLAPPRLQASTPVGLAMAAPQVPSVPAIPAVPPKPPVAMRSVTDPIALRRAVFEQVKAAASKLPPVSNKNHTLKLIDVDYDREEPNYSKKQQKEALLSGKSLSWRLKGTWQLVDNVTQQIIDQKRTTLANVPYLTNRGTFVNKGSEYGLQNQQRLLPGAYGRRRENDEVEVHVNPLAGQGFAQKYHLDPVKNKFYLTAQNNKLPLLPLLKSAGATDDEIKQAWGEEIYAANREDDNVNMLDKIFRKIDRRDVKAVAPEDKRVAIRAAFEKIQLDPDIVRHTLGQPYTNLNKDALLALSKKLLGMSRGEADPDDRDHLANQTVFGPEDLFAERIRRDYDGVQKNLLMKASFRKSLQPVQPRALEKQLQSALLKSGLGMPLEEVNPLEILDKLTRISRMGVGGIGSTQAIPSEARSVQPSQLNFVDGGRTPENMAAGVDVYLAASVKKGDDGRLYSPFIDPKTQETVYKSAQDIRDSVVAFPGAWKFDSPRIPVIRDGRLTYAKREEVDYLVPDMQEAASPLTQLVPMMSASKPHRIAMGSRMLTQAVSLVKGEAPLVQTGIKGQPGKTYQQKYGEYMGAIRAPQGGTVVAVDTDGLRVKYDDGTEETHDLYNMFPFNRKSFMHQTPLLQPGQRFDPGQVLAKSNYTDNDGNTALGLNVKTAYMNYRGLNYEDAVAISESLANKLTSEHAYITRQDYGDKSLKGKKDYVAAFPGRLTRQQLDNFDDDGVIKIGTTLNYDDPMILAADRQTNSQSRVAQRNKSVFADKTQRWDLQEPGIVTDVVKTDKGVSVVATAKRKIQLGSKLAGLYGDKGVVSAIIPDDEMPHDKNGEPFELLLSEQGLSSRTNESQMHEALLAKIAKKTGKPYAIVDFDEIEDLQRYAEEEAAKHNVPAQEEVFDPATGKKLKDKYTGYRYYVKLHHESEDKAQQRSTGRYTCFDAKTEVLTNCGWLPWPAVEESVQLATLVNDQLTFQRPTEITREFYDGLLCGFQGKYVDYLVTPNHRMWVRGTVGGRRKKPGFDWRFLQAWELPHYKAGVAARQAGFTPAEPSAAFAIGYTIPSPPRNKKNPRKRFKPRRVSAMLWWEFMGWYIAEGHRNSYKRASKTREWSVTISQYEFANPEKFQRIAWLLQKLGFKFDYVKEDTKRRPGTGRRGFRIRSKQLWFAVREAGHLARNKQIPRYLLDATPECLLRLFNALLAGDGTKRAVQTQKGERFFSRYTSTSKQLADDVQELSLRLGLGASVAPSHAQKTCRDVDELFRPYAANKRPCWTVGIFNTRRDASIMTQQRSTSRFFTQRYAGVVYCATVPAGLLITRRNGKVLVTGNSNETPAKGGEDGSKRVGTLLINGLMAHASTGPLEDIAAVRGQKNDDYHLAVMKGYTPATPKIPHTYLKHIESLRAAGINVVPDGPQTHIYAMTRKQAINLTEGREIKNAELVRPDKDMAPIPGGLFDKNLTGGNNGNRYSYIRLPEPLPNPVMEEPIRKVLGLTEKKYREILSGREELNGFRGPRAIEEALGRMDLDKEIRQARVAIAGTKKGARDEAIKKLKYLQSAKSNNVHPKEWLLDRVPVIPPVFRPISVMSDTGQLLIPDVNLLYQELIDARDNFNELKKVAGDAPDERLALYDSWKAVVGLADPIHPKLKQKNVRGLLAQISGDSPKHSMFQQQVLSRTVDMVGRGVIIPDPDLDMDSVGIPEPQLWETFRPFITRRLSRRGMSLQQAFEAIENKSPVAKAALMDELKVRPVTIDRAPHLHKYSSLAMFAKPVTGHAIRIPPVVTKGLGADFNGDSTLTPLLFLRVRGTLVSGSFEELINAYFLPGYDESKAVAKLGKITTLLEVEPGTVQVLGVQLDGTVGWQEVQFLSIHTSHGPVCYEVETDRGMSSVFTAHHNFVRLNADGMLEACKTAEVSVGSLVPYIASFDTHVPCTPAENFPALPLTLETGFWLGHWVGDGSLTGRDDTVSQAGTDITLLNFLEDVGTHFSTKRAWYEGNQNSVRWTDPELYAWLKEQFGTAADTKRIPAWVFAAPKRFRKGFFLGLLAAEMSEQERSFRVELANRLLCLQMQSLGLSLGLHSTVRPGKPERPSKVTDSLLKPTWIVTWADTSMRSLLSLLRRLPDCRQLRQLSSRIQKRMDIPVRNGWDLVPFPQFIAEAVTVAGQALLGGKGRWRSGPKLKHTNIAKEVTAAKRTGRCTRALARKIIERYSLHLSDSEAVQRWLALVENTQLLWSVITKHEQTERPDVLYDFHVPGSETFCIDGFYVTHNTMQFHVLSTDKAVTDALERQLPSKMLMTPANFNKPAFNLSQNYLAGLFLATNKRDDDEKVRTHTFKNKTEALKAIRRGEISVRDIVEFPEAD